MDLTDHRNVGRDPGCGLVDRRQMVQVQDIRFARTAKQKFTAPRIHLAFVVAIVEHREHHVWSAGSVLVGGMQRSVASRPSNCSGALLASARSKLTACARP